MIMEWLGHRDSAMVRHYCHLCDTESRRRMDNLELIGDAGTRVTSQLIDSHHLENGTKSEPQENA